MKKKILDINKYLKEKGYVDDEKEYLKHNDFFSYTGYCNKNSLIPVSRNIFMNNLKTKIDKDIGQKFIDMLWQGKTIGEGKKEFKLSFDEVSLIIEASTINNSYLGKEVNFGK